MRDSESGLERLAIGHHIGERGHVMERSRNRRTGDREDRNDFINLDESESTGQKDAQCSGERRALIPNTSSGLTRNKSNVVRLHGPLGFNLGDD